MKAGLIPPIPDLHRVPHDDFHLVLSHLLGDDRYSSFYKERSTAGDYVVLDNGAHELGVAQTHTELLERAHSIGASEIVLPDVLFDRKGTIERTKNMLKWISGDGWETFCAMGRPRLMMVPQGGNRADWSMCFDSLLKTWDLYHDRMPEELEVPVIGLSKDYDAWQGGLVFLIGHYVEPLLDVRDFDVHCLGWSNRLWVVAEIARRYPWIRSTDSAKSFVYAKNGILLEPGGPCPLYPRRDKDYFTESLTVIPPRVIKYQKSPTRSTWDLAMRNTQVFKSAAANELILKNDLEWVESDTENLEEIRD